MYAVGKFLGVYPVETITETFSKRLFAIDTEEAFNNILVFELHRTQSNDHLALCNGLNKGDLVAVNFNLVCRKSAGGKWFPTISAWSVKPYVPQTTDDFTAPPPTEGPATINPPAEPPQDGEGDLPF